MSSANAVRSPSSTMALPPYFTTTVWPWNRAIQGSASARVGRLVEPARGPRQVRLDRSCGVRRVLVDVGVGEVVGPERGLRGAGLEVDGHRDVARSEVDQAAGSAGALCGTPTRR